MSDKNDIIAKAYNEFYGSVKDTYNLAKKTDKSITLADVKKWFDGNFARKTNLRGFNSCRPEALRGIPDRPLLHA